MIDTCYRKYDFSPQFKFKNHKAYYNNNQQNHEDSRLDVHSQQIGFTPDQYQVSNIVSPSTIDICFKLV